MYVCPSHERVLLERKYQCFSVEVGMGVGYVQLVTIRSAIFCVICSFFLCVVFVSGCYVWCAYVSMGLMDCLYTIVMSFLDWPNVVLVSARMTL